MLSTSNLSASSVSLSTSTFAKLILPFSSPAAESKIGAIILHGPHHSAHMSITHFPLEVLESKSTLVKLIVFSPILFPQSFIKSSLNKYYDDLFILYSCSFLCFNLYSTNIIPSARNHIF